MRESQLIRIASIMWGSYVPTFLEAAEQSSRIELAIFSQKEIESDISCLERFYQRAARAHVIFLYWTTDGFWEEVNARLEEFGEGKVIVTTSFDPSNWGRKATVDLSVCGQAYAYLAEGGVENYRRLLNFLAHQVDPTIPIEDPLPLPWQGILHPPDQTVYPSVEAYYDAYAPIGEYTVGLFFPRHSFTNTDGSLERSLIEALEARKLNVLPVFSHGTPDKEAGALGPIETARLFFIDQNGRPRIHALINLHFFFLGRTPKGDISDTRVAAQSIDLFTRLNVPVFKPVISYSQTVEEWEDNPQGLLAEISFGIAMPEFEGNIEPILMACSRKITDPRSDTAFEIREVIAERVEHIADRVARWIKLAAKPPEERKVVFVLHKNECAGLEAGVGGAAGLDSGESVVRIMRRMQKAGYCIKNIPSSGETLMQDILKRKAIAEFRWTTVDEIIAKGGYLALLDNETYLRWFAELPEKAKKELVKSWGEPPGREMNGVPPSMVWNGKLVITGINFGNANVIMQPKRGCAGSRCDGRVCKILHDPDIPPPHQYIATYMYMDKVFGADVIIHVGTHGNLEWLPGKGAGLSSACWPDIATGTIPHLYIYNADNPAEGAVAKRRSYAVLVDHLQAIMTTAGTYGGLEELEGLLEEYDRAKGIEPARAHHLEHLIRETLHKCHLDTEIGTFPKTFDGLVARCHEIISRVKNSQTRVGMHIFGDIPVGENRAEMINTILRFDTSNPLNTRRLVFDIWGEDIFIALKTPGKRGRNGKFYSQLLLEADHVAKDMIARIIQGEDVEDILKAYSLSAGELGDRFRQFVSLVREIDSRLSASREIESLLDAMSGGYVPAGPSGYLSRGRYDILPTGRNFYNVDPTKIPTRAAFRVGVQLAEALLKRYLDEEGRYPETVGMVWLASDIMRADGEQIGQMLHLLGVRPKWKANGQLCGFEVIPLEELGRPRIDLNIRVSGILRDCFPDALKYVDRVIQGVAVLAEPPEKNFVRKHILQQAKEQSLSLDNADHFRRLSYRIFCAQPGVYRAGVNLAVYASAWKSEEDLSDIYVFWNGYAYGEGDSAYGAPAHKEFTANLKRVEVTFDKHISDEGDFLSCCGYFSNYGGMAVAAKTISGKAPKTYYGDTRDPANVTVTDFADEMRRVVRAKLLHPRYIQAMRTHGYKGAGDLSKRIGRVYGFGATTGQVDNWIFDEIAQTFVLDPEMRSWFQEVNPWALEEIGRRLLEAEKRGIWKPKAEIMEQLKEAYLEIEATLEDTISDVQGDFQGGSVDVVTPDEVTEWKSAIQRILGKGLD